MNATRIINSLLICWCLVRELFTYLCVLGCYRFLQRSVTGFDSIPVNVSTQWLWIWSLAHARAVYEDRVALDVHGCAWLSVLGRCRSRSTIKNPSVDCPTGKLRRRRHLHSRGRQIRGCRSTGSRIRSCCRIRQGLRRSVLGTWYWAYGRIRGTKFYYLKIHVLVLLKYSLWYHPFKII